MTITVSVRVKPGSSRNKITLLPDRTDRNQLQLQVQLQARAHDGQANAALVKFVAKTLGITQASVLISQGSHSRTKLLQLDCDEIAVEKRLGGHRD